MLLYFLLPWKKFYAGNVIYSVLLLDVLVLTSLLVVTDEAPQDSRHKNYDERPREAYFNGSAFLKLSSFVSVHRHSGLSFRTCEGGRLFMQKYNEDSISLEVTPDGLLFAAIIDQQRYKARLNARLLNNVWHNVNIFFRLGNLTLNAAGHTQVINTFFNIKDSPRCNKFSISSDELYLFNKSNDLTID